MLSKLAMCGRTSAWIAGTEVCEPGRVRGGNCWTISVCVHLM